MSTLNCPTCQNSIKENWKYCRFCGTKLERVEQPPKVEEVHLEESEAPAVEEKPKAKLPEFDRGLYYRVLASRGKRRQLNEKKKQLLDEVNSLLEQVKSGLVSRDYALPKIQELKKEVQSLNEEAKTFSNLPEELPIETLIDQIESAREKFAKLQDLKGRSEISKETLREAKQQYLDNIELLMDQKSVVDGHLRNWLHDLKNELKTLRKDIEMLYIKRETGEIIEEEYTKRKKALADKINEVEQIIKAVEIMIQN